MFSQSKASGSSKKSKSKSKAAAKSSEFIDSSADAVGDEAVILRKYQTVTDTLEDTDWEALQNNPNMELWALRIPRNLTVNTLDELEISLPPSTSGTSVAFTKNGVTYSVSYADTDQSETSSISAAAEMQSLSCLLPSQSRNGQLYPAPKPFSRKIVIAESPIDPTSIPQLLSNVGDDANERFPLGRSKRPFQPTHLLKHSFQPIGAGVAITARLPSVVEGPPVDVDGRDTARPAKKSKRKRHEKDLSSVADPAEPSPQEGKVKSKRMKVDGV